MRDALDEGDYYRATSGGTPYAPLTGTHDAAICIIGGGFAGLATAMSLMERGETNIVLLEGEEIGFGASGRSGGFVFGGFSRSEYGVAGTVGLEEGRKLYHLTLAAVELIRSRITRYAIDCDACEKGIYLANWFEDPKEIDDHRAFMDESMGVQWQSLNRAQLGEQLATSRYSGALYEPRAFHFNPLKYVQGVARALHAGGVRVHERSKVTTLEADGAGWRVRTGAGTNLGEADAPGAGEVRAREVVICCGGYIERLNPKLADAVLPIATYVMVTEPLGARLGTALRTHAAVYDNRFAFDYYRPLPDTRLLWGGRISVRERSSADVARMLYQDMVKVYPQLAGTRVDYAWSGRMSYGRHRMVQLGRLPDGLWYGMGFGGHGVAPTTLAGEVLAGALRGDGVDLARFAPWGLPAAGGAAGLFAAQLAYWAFELRDWMRR